MKRGEFDGSQRTILTAQSNQMTLTRSNFSVMQRKVLYAVLETLSPYLKTEITGLKNGVEIGYSEAWHDLSRIIYRASDICSPNHYNDLRKALNQLEDKRYFIETEDQEISTRLLLKFIFEKRSEHIELTVDRQLFGIILDLSSGYTLYQTKVAMSFTSIYAMKMYEVVAKWRNVPKFYISLEELRKLTDTTDKYKMIKQFKERVLDAAKTQLDASDITDLRFKYKEKKEGKAVVGFDVTIIKTDIAHDKEEILVKNKSSLRWDFTQPLLDNFARYGVILKGKNIDLIKEYKLKFGDKKLSEELDYFAKISEGKSNPPAYIISCFKKALNTLPKPPKVVTIPKSIGAIIPDIVKTVKVEKEVWQMDEAERREHTAKVRAQEPTNLFGEIFKQK